MRGLTGISAIASDVLGASLNPYMPYNFLVELDGLVTGGFMEVSGLESEIKLESCEEGGQNDYVHHFPTRTTYPNLVLSKGLTDVWTLWGWYDDACHGMIRRRNGTIMLLDHQRLPVRWWNFKDAYPVKWTGPQFNSSAQDVAVEKIELVHRGITIPMASKGLSGIRTADQIGRLGASQAVGGIGGASVARAGREVSERTRVVRDQASTGLSNVTNNATNAINS
ncbi:phage tail protein [Phormidium sp. CLA17]|uniref:phage tail protein n=1 Tax=Leptolyngbya sp. Cla-17 TaxID=2803751 RepID=UPI001490F117|nr:phage tail protein [Leptolyngbya sp. Cla-17]MBM0744171.1 phage tail protein [Leptolyngbya sp. Cla-17]